LTDYIKLFFKGTCMGVADVIPGVSGGTLALMLNIYERLISAIKSISPSKVLPIFKNLLIWKESHRQGLMKALNELDAFFLITVGAGIFTAVIALSSQMPHLISKYTEYTFACFMGLIIPSISIPWKMIKEKHANQYISLILGLAFTVGISLMIKQNGAVFGTDQSFGMVCLVLFFCALIAISAMILPGISGSFILMLLGQYVFVSGLISRLKMYVLSFLSSSSSEIPERKKAALALVDRFSDFQVIILVGVFIIGCAIGIILMSKVIHYALQRAHDTTMAFLTGMICSSIYVLWPFKGAQPDGMGLEKIKWLKKAPNILPELNNTTYIALAIFAAAMIFSTCVIYFGNRQAATLDTDA
jgi:putative membrane protein